MCGYIDNELILYVLYLLLVVVVVMANTVCTVSIGSDPFVRSIVSTRFDCPFLPVIY